MRATLILLCLLNLATPAHADPLADLGRLLFWDPLLSGNRDIACGTCHHPRFGTSDGRARGLGAGGQGVGPGRQGGAELPRNTPALFNLGEATALFLDGRIEATPEGIRSPAGDDLPDGLSGPLAAQALFPLVMPEEMAGHGNPVAEAVARGDLPAAWAEIAGRVAAAPAYARRFAGAGVEPDAAGIANALAAFVTEEWRSDDSPYDRHLAGVPLAGAAAEGLAAFESAGCGLCHSGPLQTDGQFHATGAPQAGPGMPGEAGGDSGRARVTGRPGDRGAFRTPSLRNVALTGPYGHAGTEPNLPAFAAAHAEALGRPLSAGEAQAIQAFLLALTGDTAMEGRTPIPVAVPSGLPVDR